MSETKYRVQENRKTLSWKTKCQRLIVKLCYELNCVSPKLTYCGSNSCTREHECFWIGARAFKEVTKVK